MIYKKYGPEINQVLITFYLRSIFIYFIPGQIKTVFNPEY